MRSRITPDHRAQLEALRRAYGEELPRRVQEIEVAVEALQGEPPPRVALEASYHLVHRLAGSSAIYGFEDVRRAASALEGRLAAVMESGETEAGFRVELESCVGALRRALADRASEG